LQNRWLLAACGLAKEIDQERTAASPLQTVTGADVAPEREQKPPQSDQMAANDSRADAHVFTLWFQDGLRSPLDLQDLFLASQFRQQLQRSRGHRQGNAIEMTCMPSRV
jgi:hypothetical protein